MDRCRISQLDARLLLLAHQLLHLVIVMKWVGWLAFVLFLVRPGLAQDPKLNIPDGEEAREELLYEKNPEILSFLEEDSSDSTSEVPLYFALNPRTADGIIVGFGAVFYRGPQERIPGTRVDLSIDQVPHMAFGFQFRPEVG